MPTEKETKTYMLKVRLTSHEQAKIEAHAAKHGLTLSRTIREYIRRLPVPPTLKQQQSIRSQSNRSVRKHEIIFNNTAEYEDNKASKLPHQHPELVADDQEERSCSSWYQETETEGFSFWVAADSTLKNVSHMLDKAILGLGCSWDGWDQQSIPGEVFKIYTSASLNKAQEAIALAQAQGVQAGMYEE